MKYRSSQKNKIQYCTDRLWLRGETACDLDATTMVLLSFSKRLNRWLGPFLLHQGVKARYAVAGGILRDNLFADSVCLLPLAQKLIQIEVYDDTKSQVQEQASKELTADDEAATRIRVLESYLRPALVKNEVWSDVRKWQFHTRLVKWARTEFLLAKHGAAIRSTLNNFPAIRKSPQLMRQRGGSTANILPGKLPFALFGDDNDRNDEQLGSTAKLPYSSLLTKAFGMSDWSQSKNWQAAGKDMGRIAAELGGTVINLRGGSISVAHIPDDADLSTISLEAILELAGGHVIQCGPFNALCEDAGIYQFWTRDYVEQMGRYLLQRAASTARETVILDVGAGDGLLAQLLREVFEVERERFSTVKDQPSKSRSPRGKAGIRPLRKATSLKNLPNTIATDNGTWGIAHKANVERLSVQETIDTYSTSRGDKQVIVVCSWMPMEEDWSALFRNGNVDEYILIGECDDGQCGNNWETWGNKKYLVDDFDEDALSSSSDITAEASKTGTEEVIHITNVFPPYKLDGYERRDLDELSAYQFSRFDCHSSKFGKTVSFRRRGSLFD